MAPVSDALVELLRQQVKQHGTVVWYDPEGHYGDLATRFAAEIGVPVHSYDGARGLFWLRHELEPLWAPARKAPPLVIYIPRAQSECDHALVEYEAGGVVVQPGQMPAERDSSLVAIARKALGGSLTAAELEQVLDHVQAGKLSLANLDALADRGSGVATGALGLVFNVGSAEDIAFAFLSMVDNDAQLESKQLLPELARLLESLLATSFPAASAAALRHGLVRHILFTDLAQALGDDLPEAWHSIPLSGSRAGRRAAVSLAEAWRQRRDVAQGYARWADRVEEELLLSSQPLTLAVLSRAHTFRTHERALQAVAEAALAEAGASEISALLELARRRISGFWSSAVPELKARWLVIAAAAELLAQAERVRVALKGRKLGAAALMARYTGEDGPWCELDTAHRRLERDFRAFETDSDHDGLLVLVARARRQYALVSDALAERFTHALEAERFDQPGVPHQSDTYRQVVEPLTQNRRFAYVLVDGLRYEMARELLALLDQGWQAGLSHALATPPTITDVGMAALMPGAENGLSLETAGAGSLSVSLAGKPMRNRQERVAQFRARAGDDAVVARLDELAPLTDPHLRAALKRAPAVLVTATEEIDSLAESSPSLARRMLDDSLNQLRRGIKTLIGLGIVTIVITADHGYLLGETPTGGEGIDAPGGDMVLLKRRVWLGRGGSDAPGYLRTPLSAFGIGGGLELATPRNLSYFKAPGRCEYMHGGLSLPEAVVPVLVVQAEGAQQPGATARVTWKLTLGSRGITTRFLTVTVEGSTAELLPLPTHVVRLEVRDGTRPISQPVAASYGYSEASGDVSMRVESQYCLAKNSVTLMVEEAGVDEVTVVLLDATTGVILSRLEHVPYLISL